MACLLHILTCPVCHTHFTRVGNVLKCANVHSFDLAKEGYVNLQLKKRSGDTKEMLLARRTFLEHGYYQPLSGALNELVYDYLRTGERRATELVNILDAGCGEGYYLGRLAQHLENRFEESERCYVGLDISKEAVRMAAKRYKSAQFVVANLWERLVFANSTFSVLLNILAPRNVEEFARIIMPGGIVVVVLPTSTHLLQLRTTLRLLNIEEDKQQRVIEQFSGYFELLTERTVEYSLNLAKEEIAQIVLMTPNYWHLSEEVREKLESVERLETQVGFACLVFRKANYRTISNCTVHHC